MQVRALKWSDFPDLVENYYALYDEVKASPSVGIILFAERPSMAAEAR